MSCLKINLNLLKILYKADHEHVTLRMGINPNSFKNKDVPKNEPAMQLKLIFKGQSFGTYSNSYMEFVSLMVTAINLKTLISILSKSTKQCKTVF